MTASEHSHTPKIHETCPCGASIDVTSTDAREVVGEWRDAHPHGQPSDRRTGGFTANAPVGPPRIPKGHNNLEIRAMTGGDR